MFVQLPKSVLFENVVTLTAFLRAWLFLLFLFLPLVFETALQFVLYWLLLALLLFLLCQAHVLGWIKSSDMHISYFFVVELQIFKLSPELRSICLRFEIFISFVSI